MKLHKLFFAIPFIVFPIFAACNQYDDSGINERIDNVENRLDKLESLVNHINSNMGALATAVKALQEEDHIESVVRLEDGSGYIVTFSNSGKITIFNGKDGEDGKNGKDGKDGKTPEISIILDDDGNYYWTVNGEYLLVNNEKVPATAKVAIPEIRIRDGRFELSFDNWATFTDIGDAGVGGSEQGIVFIDILDLDNSVVFLLGDGRTIEIPKSQQFSLNIDEIEYTITPGGVYTIDFTLTEPDPKTVVDAFGTGGFSAEVTRIDLYSGKIRVCAPDPLTNGKVYVFAVNMKGMTSAKILSFEEGVFNIDPTPTLAPVPADGGNITIPISHNMNYMVSIPTTAKDWVSIVETKSIIDGFTVLSIAKNATAEMRDATINFTNDNGAILGMVMIIQEPGSGGEDQPNDGYFNSIEDWSNDGDF